MNHELLHFGTDDKFIPLAIAHFEAAFPGRNRFRLMKKRKQTNFVPLSESVLEVSTEYFSGGAADAEVAACQLLVIHGMRPNFVEVINRAPKSVTVLWCGWGFDYYTLLGTGALLPLTAAAVPVEPAQLSTHPLAQAAGRIDLCSVLPTEIAALRAAVPELTASLHPIHYYSTEDTFASAPTMMRGNDILLGNSADPTNNHLDALEALARCALRGSRVVVPLSYGGPAEYVELVKSKGRALFGDSFVALDRFMPLEEFNRTIAGCGVVVMNHLRQQALGTTSQALYRGAKLYLRPESPVYRFYEPMGITMGRWEPQEALLTPLSEEDAARNREIIAAFWSRNAALKQILALEERSR